MTSGPAIDSEAAQPDPPKSAEKDAAAQAPRPDDRAGHAPAELDPDAPGAALVDPDVEQAEPNEPA